MDETFPKFSENPTHTTPITGEWKDTRSEIVSRVSNILAGGNDFTETVKIALDELRLVFGVDTCIIRTLERDDLVLVACSGVEKHRLQARVPSAWGLAGEMLSTLKPLLVPNILHHPSTNAYIGTLPNALLFTFYAGFPLFYRKKVIGVLGLYAFADRPHFNQTDMFYLDTLCHPLSIALMNWRLETELTQANHNLNKLQEHNIQLESDLSQALKMESLGRLAGGVAHDFNNLLTAIIGFNNMAMDEVGEDSPAYDYLENIFRASTRASDLTQQLLAFARKQITIPSHVWLNQQIQEASKIFKTLLGDSIDVRIETATERDCVYIDKGQLQQILLNLVVNARDAMPHGGCLTIRTESILLDEYAAKQRDDLTPGYYVKIEIRDTGLGMTEEVMSHLFEPFFTTKAQGRGTGLGLSTCYGIVKQNRGHIEVHSKIGRGTTFAVYLPYLRHESNVVGKTPEPVNVNGGKETVLLVEDEVWVREIAAYTLRTYGYTVHIAKNGLEGLNISLQKSGNFDLLLTDVEMPEMGGRDLARRIQVLYPMKKVLFISGYYEGDALLDTKDNEQVHFLHKPFTPEMLARAVREVLDTTP